MFNTILVPTDGTKLSQKAVAEAIDLAHLAGAKLVAVHVYPKFTTSPYGAFGPSDDEVEKAHVAYHKSAAQKLFAAIKKAADARSVALETVLVQGNDIYKQLIGVAKKKKCDLICMASHGRRGLSGLVLGSETQKVLTHSTIRVLVLR